MESFKYDNSAGLQSIIKLSINVQNMITKYNEKTVVQLSVCKYKIGTCKFYEGIF